MSTNTTFDHASHWKEVEAKTTTLTPHQQSWIQSIVGKLSAEQVSAENYTTERAEYELKPCVAGGKLIMVLHEHEDLIKACLMPEAYFEQRRQMEANALPTITIISA
ncbi:hypothetical protein [Fibrella aestuarina]|uniref:hypothetical protein n=1 Tax=Fibrella aestuarina TaxID=651143 RepID=UPI00059B96E5|nr:hypothetical protein [Fibrella aestuarina]